jgi:peptide/nickel transport system substrate-binding protein
VNKNFRAKGISRVVVIAVIIVVVIIVLGAGLYVSFQTKSTTSTPTTQTSTSTPTSSTSTSPTSSMSTQPTSTQTTSSTSTTITSTTTSTTSSAPTTFTYETLNTPRELDPQVSYGEYDYNILQNVYETLLWFNGANGNQTIPWLASNYTLSADGKIASFTLRSGINFADGEQLNSTAVYLSLTKLLITDNAAPSSFGTQGSWILQQLLNTSLSYDYNPSHGYTQAWGNAVLAQHFVQITGPLTFNLNLQTANAAFPFLFANQWSGIVAPDYVMQHDLALWNQPSNGYTLPYPTPSGNATTMINEYLLDEVATCGTGATVGGCGATYLDTSYQGSLAGSGPYTIVSVGQTTNNIVLQANPNYWGGPLVASGGAAIVPTFKTIDINYVPSLTTRELDLQTAARTGQAFSADIPDDHLYDVADRNAWLNNHVLTSVIPGVSLYGPYTGFHTDMDLFATNVTNQITKLYYAFQPFADIRFRLAFADSVNMTQINLSIDNGLGRVAINGMPPGFPPAGTFNTSIVPIYSFNPDKSAQLLIQAMQQPLTKFNFENGTAAPAGVFNNTFGCSSLGSNGACTHSVPQTITLSYPSGDSVNQQIDTQIASVINNISETYNMGLSVQLAPIPQGIEVVDGFSGYLYFWSSSADADYPWSIDFTGPLYAEYNLFTGPAGWDLSVLGNLYNQAFTDTATNNITGLVAATNMMNEISNQEVQYLWTLYPAFYQPITSNVKGFYFNPSVYGTIEYFAALS